MSTFSLNTNDIFSRYRDDCEERLRSLSTWPKASHFNIEEFAAVGFVYLPSSLTCDDMLRCAFCPCAVADWDDNDDPCRVHAEMAPCCSHLMKYKGKEFIDQVLKEDNDNSNNTDVGQDDMIREALFSKKLSICGLLGPIQRKEQRAAHSVMDSPIGLGPSSKPVHTEMMKEDRRRRTFELMSGNCIAKFDLDILSEAGFFFEGKPEDGDRVCCYYCGHRIEDWSHDDDPWKEHARHSPSCQHVVLTKGEYFVKQVQNEKTPSISLVEPALQASTLVVSNFNVDVPNQNHEQQRSQIVLERCRTCQIWRESQQQNGLLHEDRTTHHRRRDGADMVAHTRTNAQLSDKWHECNKPCI